MALSTYGSKHTHTGDGTTARFQAPEHMPVDAHLIVRVDGTVKTIGTHYYIDRSGMFPVVVFKAGSIPAGSAAIVISRATPAVISGAGNRPDFGPWQQNISFYRTQEMLDNGGGSVFVPFQYLEADLIANNALDLVSPCNGRIVGLRTIVNKLITTGGTVGLKVGTTTVVGQTAHSHAASLAKGGVIQSTIADPSVVTAYVNKGDRIQIVPASFASAGQIMGHVEIMPFG